MPPVIPVIHQMTDVSSEKDLSGNGRKSYTGEYQKSGTYFQEGTKMGEVIVVTSGKGGVGKTTTVANLGTGLAMLNKKNSRSRYRYRTS